MTDVGSIPKSRVGSVPKTLAADVTARRDPAPAPPSDAPRREPLAPEPPPRRSSFPVALLGALVAIGALVVVWQIDSFRGVGESPRTAPAASATPAEPLPSTSAAPDPGSILPVATVAPVASSPAEIVMASADGATPVPGASASAAPTAGEDLPLPAGAVIAPGQGLLDIETGAREAIFVDNVELGRGPFLRLTLTPGIHEVRLRAHGEERIRFVLIRSARRTRLPLSSVWTR